jgi:TatD DNase family protein
MRIFDAHCHLHDERLAPSLEDAMTRARNAGVAGYFNCSATEGGWGEVTRFAETHREVIPAFGLHPWYIPEAGKDWLERLKGFLARPQSAVGEIGLDQVVTGNVSMAIQEEVFRMQLALALELDVPANIHCRKAWEPLIRNLRRVWKKGKPFVIHSFSGTTDTIPPLAELGAYFSFSGSLTRSHNTRAHKSIKAVPRDRLLVETDAPDIPPEIDHKIDYQTPNEPQNIIRVIEKAAELLGVNIEEIASVTWENACRMLGALAASRGFDCSR